MLQESLSPVDADRALRSFRKLARHDIGPWALTGGLATEIHRLVRGCEPRLRPLNDIDFIADSFECIPETLADDFLFRHIHPRDPPNRTMLQCIDPDTALRIDIFRACGATMNRTSKVDLTTGMIQIISLEDLTARMARLAMGLAVGVQTPSEHARDYLRLAELVDAAEVESAWRDHRKPRHPVTFAEASGLLQRLIPARDDLLIAREYSKDYLETCPRCASTAVFKLADPKVVFDLLGYA
jgi:hypothetical protein